MARISLMRAEIGSMGITEFIRKVGRKATGPSDPYFYLLDHPRERDLKLCGARIPYMSPRFQRATYETASGKSFASHEEAYEDWLNSGRKLGTTYAPGKDTTLKIILKVKDEPELLEHWIEHHAGIVGHENIVILDTGSTDPRHLEILQRYESDILILSYKQHYDRVHVVEANREFYSLISSNCKYLTVLDADEFLFYRDGDTLSKQGVTRTLRASAEPILCGTWVYNIAAPPIAQGRINWDAPISFSLNSAALISGTVSGKAILRSSHLLNARNMGHNMHVRETLALVTPSSLGRFVVLHVAQLGELTRARELKHVLTHVGALSGNIDDALRSLASDPKVSRKVKSYISRYFNPVIRKEGPNFTTKLLSPALDEEACEGMAQAFENMDFTNVVTAAEKRIQAAFARGS